MTPSGPSQIPLDAPGHLYLASLADVAPDVDTAIKGNSPDVVVCLVQDSELSPFPEYRRWLDEDPRALRLPIEDRGIIRADALLDLGATVAAAIQSGKTVVIHCFAGMGRSSLAGAAALVGLGVSIDDALKLIGNARPGAGPETPGQHDLIAAMRAASGEQSSIC